MSDPFRPKRRYDLAGHSIMIAMPAHRDLPAYTAVSLLNIQRECLERGIPVAIEIDYGNSLVHHARTFMAWRFLQSEHDLLFWIDSDISCTGADFLRIAALTTVMPIVAAAYPAKLDPPLFMMKMPEGPLVANEHRCIAFAGVGLGFACMRREVVEAVAKAAPLRRYHQFPEPIPRIFRLDGVTADNGDAGEDMAFFEDAAAQGFQLWVDPTVKLGHIGQKVYSAALIDHLVTKEK